MTSDAAESEDFNGPGGSVTLRRRQDLSITAQRGAPPKDDGKTYANRGSKGGPTSLRLDQTPWDSRQETNFTTQSLLAVDAMRQALGHLRRDPAGALGLVSSSAIYLSQTLQYLP